MQEKQTPSRGEKRRAWDANYRDKHREQRREYDRSRMRRLRAEQGE